MPQESGIWEERHGNTLSMKNLNQRATRSTREGGGHPLPDPAVAEVEAAGELAGRARVVEWMESDDMGNFLAYIHGSAAIQDGQGRVKMSFRRTTRKNSATDQGLFVNVPAVHVLVASYPLLSHPMAHSRSVQLVHE
jgi:hypothetical protein